MSAVLEKTARRIAAATAESTPLARGPADNGRLIAALTKLPADVHRELQSLAEKRGTSVSSLLRGLVEASLVAPESTTETRLRPHARIARITLQISTEDLRRVETHAARIAAGQTTALADLLRLGLAVAEESEGIPASRADELFEVLHALESLLSRVGPAAFGTQVLLAYWVAKASSGKVEEDELLQQSRLVGADEWARVLDELRHETRAEV